MTLKNIKHILLLVLTILLASCAKDQKKQNPFEVSSNKVGLINNTTQLYQLDSLYANDSIVRETSSNKFLNSNEIKIYEKGGKKLLILEPRNPLDSLSTIKNIQIIDPRFETASGLSSKSYFKDIKDNYDISKINNTLSAAVIFVDSIQAYFTVSKRELPNEYKLNTDLKIDAAKIPDSAKIKHFLISWDKN